MRSRSWSRFIASFDRSVENAFGSGAQDDNKVLTTLFDQRVASAIVRRLCHLVRSVSRDISSISRSVLNGLRRNA